MRLSRKRGFGVGTRPRFHYGHLYTYISDENVFFAVTFALSFLLGSPCVLVGVFG